MHSDVSMLLQETLQTFFFSPNLIVGIQLAVQYHKTAQ